MKLNSKPCGNGQSMLEFTFTMIVIALLLAGMLKLFAWSAKDLARRRQAHEEILTEPLDGTGAAAPLKQVRPTFYGASGVDATVPSNIYSF